jgi:hypothetical protein
MEAHPGAMEAHPGAMEAHFGATEAHPVALCDKKPPPAHMCHSDKVKMCRLDFWKKKLKKLFHQTKNYMTQKFILN